MLFFTDTRCHLAHSQILLSLEVCVWIPFCPIGLSVCTCTKSTFLVTVALHYILVTRGKSSFLILLQSYICSFWSFTLQMNLGTSLSNYIENILFGFCLTLSFRLVEKTVFKMKLNFLINEYSIAYDLYRSSKNYFLQ